MCGIAGIVGADALKHGDVLQKMMDAMGHRGPDDQGVIHGAAPDSGGAASVMLGHRRLSIIDLSSGGHQPMSFADDRFTIVFNGEIYNYPVLKAELDRLGHVFRTSSDTEVIMAAYAEWGPSCVSRFNGMFAFALWDRERNRVFLARDRYGQKPLYYRNHDGLLLFASELRALLASGLVERHANRDAVAAYLSYGAVHGDATMVVGVHSFPPGSSCHIDLRRSPVVDPTAYWDFPREKEQTDAAGLRQAFVEAVDRHMISDAPVGIFLSGGIDSSAVAAAAVRIAGASVRTLAVTYPEQPEQCEGVHARRVADAIGSTHVDVPITGHTLLDLLPRALNGMDQPTIDGVNTYVVSYAARTAGFKVALSGLGADELFGGYRGHFVQPGYMVRLRKVAAVLRSPLGRLLSLPGDHRQFGKLADLMASPGDLLSAYLIRRKLFSSAQVGKMLPVAANSPGWLSGLTQERMRQLRERIDGRAYADVIGILEMSHYMGELLLRDTDAMGMAHSIEIRVPFLDNAFSQCALCLDPSARIPGDVPKHRFVEAVREWLPIENILRTKQGFRMPFCEWMQNELRSEVNRGIAAIVTRLGPEQGGFADQIWKKFLAHPEAVGWSRPWALFVLGRYLENHDLRLDL